MIESGLYSLDAGLSLTARCIVALVFGAAVVHKLMAPRIFIATLDNYRLLPTRLALPAAAVIVAAEIAVTAGLGFGARYAGFVAIGLLALYSAAILVNLARDRRDIDCGCSGPAMRQTLGPWLVWRNFCLLMLAGLATLPTVDRGLGLTDFLTTTAALIVFALLYTAANQLAATAPRFTKEAPEQR